MTSPQLNKYCARLTHWLDHLLEKTLIALVALMVANVLWQVATRFVIGNPSSFTEELARFVLIWLAFLGGVYAYRRGSNISLDVVSERLSPSLEAVVKWIVLLAVIAFALAAMCYGGFRLMMLTFELGQRSAALGVPMGVVYSVIPLSGILITLYALLSLTPSAESSAAVTSDPN